MTQGTEDLPYDISERLRAARMQALAKRKVVAPVRKAAPRGAALWLHSHFGTRRRRRLVERAGIGHPPHGAGDWTIRYKRGPRRKWAQ